MFGVWTLGWRLPEAYEVWDAKIVASEEDGELLDPWCCTLQETPSVDANIKNP